MKNAKVFEVDHPPTQEYKKLRVRDTMGEPPANVIYAPVDFARQTLQEVLPGLGYSTSQNTFFVLEGVTMYLTEEQNLETLRFVAEYSGPDSLILFNIQTPEFQNLQSTAAFKHFAEEAGEPWIFNANEDTAANLVEKAGLKLESCRNFGELFIKYLPFAGAPNSYLGSRRTERSFCLAINP